VLVAVAGRARLKAVRDLVHTQDGHRVHLEVEPLRSTLQRFFETRVSTGHS
jgi:hypothetical protein